MPTIARVARIHEYGPPEVLRFEDIVVGEPGDDEALIRNTVIGLNFVDVYYRRGSLSEFITLLIRCNVATFALAEARMTSGASATNFSADRPRSASPTGQRVSIRTLRPSVQPHSRVSGMAA
jgi:hypothetical protein